VEGKEHLDVLRSMGNPANINIISRLKQLIASVLSLHDTTKEKDGRC
jgi:hypothetical protein